MIPLSGQLFSLLLSFLLSLSLFPDDSARVIIAHHPRLGSGTYNSLVTRQVFPQAEEFSVRGGLGRSRRGETIKSRFYARSAVLWTRDEPGTSSFLV